MSKPMYGRMAIALLLLAACSARAEEWVALRPPPRGTFEPPQILIDTSSIVVLDSGLRRATTKVDFFLGSPGSETFPPNALRFMIWIQTYDCAKGLTHSESNVATLADGTVISHDTSANPKWYPRASPAADPAFDFVCQWPTTPSARAAAQPGR